MKILLTVKDGTLYFPQGGSDAMNGEWDCPDLPSLLVRHYDAGDCDTCPWPMTSEFATVEELRIRLALALFDERESNACWPNVPVTILLPDGERFDFDAVLAEDELSRRLEPLDTREAFARCGE